MSNVKIISGNIFTSRCQTIVNTVNCVGVMGAGLALECRLRYPQMFTQYAKLCAGGQFDIGKLWLYKASDRWVLNFPTKKDWKMPSKEDYLRRGLDNFCQTYEARGITSIAFPLLGAQHGGLTAERSLEIMCEYLSPCAIPVEIYRYDPRAEDDVYGKFKSLLQTLSAAEVVRRTGLRRQFVTRLVEAVQSPEICQLNQLAACRGIGDKTLESAFAMMRSDVPARENSGQGALDV